MHPLASIRKAMERQTADGRYVRLGAHNVEGYSAGNGLTGWAYAPRSILGGGVSPLGALVLGQQTRARDIYAAAAELVGGNPHWVEGFQVGCSAGPVEYRWRNYLALDRAAAELGRLSGMVLFHEMMRRCRACGSWYPTADASCSACQVNAETTADVAADQEVA